MAFTFTVNESTRINADTFETKVTATNGVKTFVDTFINNGDVAQLAALVKARAAKQNANGMVPAIPAGTLLDLSDPPPPTPPTQAELDAQAARVAWLTAYRKVQALQRLRAAGVTAVTAQQVTDAITALNALPYLAGYEASA